VARKKGKKVEMKEEARGKKVCVCVVVANERKTKKVKTRKTKVETRTRKKGQSGSDLPVGVACRAWRVRRQHTA
jgi:hypothetical protein